MEDANNKAILQRGNRIVRKGYRILKDCIQFDKEGLKRELEPVHRKILSMKGARERKIISQKIQAATVDKTVIVMPPVLDWEMELFQRPQQLAMAYSKKKDTVVLYLTANTKYDRIAFAKEVMPNLWVINSYFANQINNMLVEAKKIILSISWTINKPYLSIIKADKVIYEYIDDLSIFSGYDEKMEQDHIEMMHQADITVCTASKLYNQAVGKAKMPILSPNAGDYDFFSKTEEAEINPLIKEKIGNYRTVLGYYGALAEWFDYDLVKRTAINHPDWIWILVGMDYDGSLVKSGILDVPNVCYIPPQPYKKLPTFLKGFDIATIPFVINDITLATSPVKLFEYMAAGKPIITSKMPECLKYTSVMTYTDSREFEGIAEAITKLERRDLYWEQLKEDALNNTWDARTDEILSYI